MSDALKLQEQQRDARLLIVAYMALLCLPPQSSRFRALNQDIYGRLRDEIARVTGRDEQSVQDEFEAALIDASLPPPPRTGGTGR